MRSVGHSPLLPGFSSDRRRRLLVLLEVCPVQKGTQSVILVDVFLLVRQLVHRRQEGDGLARGEQGQQVGRKELRHDGDGSTLATMVGGSPLRPANAGQRTASENVIVLILAVESNAISCRVTS